ncbi:hypothetical protein MTR67_001947 [Solanum verrucosum]|uniref:Uncharacterized protein n=1 Tax=Solanum verrucosum TaxID=315347 RepID=A0AAF0PPJ1_SOLVR|nr:hypothetical protein MTR67_001947 [Solanum verrucosum]
MHQWNMIFEIRKVSFLFRSSPVKARSVISKLMCAFSYSVSVPLFSLYSSVTLSQLGSL